MEVGYRLRKAWDGEELGEIKYIKNGTTGFVYKIELIEIDRGEAVWLVVERIS